MNGWSKPFTYTRLIICEGPDDAAFLHHFITQRNLRRCHIRHTGKSRHSAGGNTKFDDALRNAKLNPEFGKIQRILLISDNDLAPEKSFKAVQRQVENAGFGVAQAELVPNAHNPTVTIAMVPLNGAQGNLECLLLASARSRSVPIDDQVREFEAAIHADDWDVSRNGKMRLRVSLAARCVDPFVSLGNVFADKRYRQADLIPLGHTSLHPLRQILFDFLR